MAVNVADLIATLRMDASQFTRGAETAGAAARNLAGSITASGKSSMAADAQTKALSSRVNGYTTAVGAARDHTVRYSEVLGRRVPESAKQAAGGISAMNAAIAVAFGAVALRKLTQWGSALYNIGAESEVMGLRYKVVFGDMTGELDKWVDRNITAFGTAKDEMQGYLAQVANMLIPLGLSVEASADVARNVLEMANAWSIWSGGTYTSLDAAEAITKGLMGQTRGLVNLGMKIDDTSLQQALLAAGTADLTGEDKTLAEMQARLNLLMDRSGPAYEVAGQAMDGATGAARNLQTQLATLKDTIGGLAAAGPGQGFVGTAGGFLQGLTMMLQQATVSTSNDPAVNHARQQAVVDAMTTGWYTHGTAESLAAEMSAWQSEMLADLVANPLNIPQQVRNALIEQLYGVAGGEADPTALRDLFTSLADAMPGQAAALAGVFRSVIGESIPNWTPPADVMTRGAGVFALRLANAYAPKVAEVGEKVVDWIARAAERESLRQEAVLAVAAQFDALPGLIAAREGDVRAAIADLVASMGSSAELQQTITQLSGAGYAGIAGMLLGAGDTAETRAAAAELGAALATAEGQAYLSTLEWEIEYANNKAAWAASASIAADSARWAGAGAAAAAAVAAGYDSYLAGHPLTPPAPGGSPGGGGGTGFVPESYSGATVQIGMVIGDDTQVAKAVDTALRRAKQRGM